MRRACALLLTAGLVATTACTTADKGFETTAKSPVKAKRRIDGSIDDRSLCDWRGRKDRETSETAGPGSFTPNVRRVYQVAGSGEDRRKVLVCREIDTNFDGVKDVVRRYTETGESLHEESDSNYDGRLDTWIAFARGRLAEVRTDNDGDGKPDVWEIYQDGKLERMGTDIDADERVDRWDHDTEVRRKLEEAERKKEEQAAAEAAKKAAAAQAAAEADAEEADPGAKKPDPKKDEP